MISLILKMMMKIKINNPRRIQHPARVIFYFHFDLHPTYFKIDAIRKICGKKFYYNLKIKLSVFYIFKSILYYLEVYKTEMNWLMHTYHC